MSKASFSITELYKVEEFDAEKAEKNFNSRREYYDKLSEYVEKSHLYLHSYNPTVAVYGEEIRKAFVAEMENVRNLLTSLEMTFVLAELLNLQGALIKNDVKGLSDGLVKFFAKNKITADRIIAARTLILAVDDRPEILTTITGVLEDRFKVIAVTNGNEALKVIELHTPGIFILDIEMPDMDGYELADKIKAEDKFKNTPIIFLTGKSSKDHVEAAIVTGVNAYVLKPVNKNVLLSKIERLLDL